MYAHRGREILVLPASCSSGSGHHHCHFTSDCTDSGNCLLLAVEKQSVKGVGRLLRHNCLSLSVHKALLLPCFCILVLMSWHAFFSLVTGEEAAD